eukprot:scaffold90374_cov60-Phaeocystis_antarctica.AAC.2
MVTYIVTMPSEEDTESRRYKCVPPATALVAGGTAPSPCRHRRASPHPHPRTYPHQISVCGERGPVV